MDCGKSREMLSAYHDGELSEVERTEVRSHLRDCPDCTALLQSLARLDAAVGVPDPGPDYWESFNRRVEERIGRETARPDPPVVPHPAWDRIRRQLRYLVPAVAAAAMVVAVVRQAGMDRGAPVPGTAPPASVADRAPAPPEAPRPGAGEKRKGVAVRRTEEGGRPLPTGSGLDRTGEAKARSETADRHPAAPGAEPPAGPAGEAAHPRHAVGAAPEMERAPPERQEETVSRKESRLGPNAPAPPGKGTPETAETAREDLPGSRYPSPCEGARALATRGRFREAETAQRACLARDDSAGNQEAGLVFLAELLDRQHRFAEADSVIEEAAARFPASRPLDLYRQQRPEVQSGRIPFPAQR